MKITFQDYETQRTKSGGEPIISILSRGGFGFSNSFFERYEPKRPQYISLKYAQDMDFIYVGFVFSNERIKNSLKVYYPKAKNGLALAVGFFKKYGISHAKYKGRYTAEEYKDDISGKMYLIKLKK